MVKNYSFHLNSTNDFILFSHFFVSPHRIDISTFSPLRPSPTTAISTAALSPTPTPGPPLCTRREEKGEPRGAAPQYVNTRSEKFASSQSPAIISLSSGVQ